MILSIVNLKTEDLPTEVFVEVFSAQEKLVDLLSNRVLVFWLKVFYYKTSFNAEFIAFPKLLRKNISPIDSLPLLLDEF